MAPALSPRRLRLLDLSRPRGSPPLADLGFPDAVLAVRLAAARLVVVLAREARVFDAATLRPLAAVETGPNPKGIAALAQGGPSSPPSAGLAAPAGEGEGDEARRRRRQGAEAAYLAVPAAATRCCKAHVGWGRGGLGRGALERDPLAVCLPAISGARGRALFGSSSA